MDVLVHDETGAGPAHLAGVHEDAKAHRLGGGAKVGVGEHEVSALATEFEGDGRQALAGLGHHGLAGGDATGQDDAVHTGVAG